MTSRRFWFSMQFLAYSAFSKRALQTPLLLCLSLPLTSSLAVGHGTSPARGVLPVWRKSMRNPSAQALLSPHLGHELHVRPSVQHGLTWRSVL